MRIRPETPADYAAIRNINIAAFANQPYSQQTEHLIVEELRKAGALSVSLVAEIDRDDGSRQVVGHIAFSPAKIDGRDCGSLIAGPLAVLPERQRQGIGSALMNAGLDAIRKLGVNGCVLVGHPEYYGRFGFRHEPSLTMEGVPPEVFFCLPFTGPVPHGRVTCHEAFFVKAS
jgi:putative acetyltransferase